MKFIVLQFIFVFVCYCQGKSRRCQENDDECRPSAIPQDPSSQCCGVDVTSHQHIFGGEPTQLRQYPWLGLIEYKILRKKQIVTMCGSSLISSGYVLTAAHCVRGKVLTISRPVSVRLGEFNKTNSGPDCIVDKNGTEKDCIQAISIPIKNIIVHPMHNKSEKYRHDLALIRLRKNAPYTDHIRPICLPSAAIETLTPGSKLYVTGWGKMKYHFKGPHIVYAEASQIKRHVAVPFVPFKQCQRFWPSVTKKEICAGGEIGKSSCNGDSGGPLMMETEGHYELVGIVSYGTMYCAMDTPVVHVKVSSYIDWIMDNIRR